MTISTQCLDCKYYTGLITCEAYPDRIPQEIFDGTVDHTVPYPGDGGITFEPLDVKLSSDQIKAVVTKLSDKGLLKKFEIPDEILEQAGIDPKKMSPDQLKLVFTKLEGRGLFKLNEEPKTGGRKGLVKKKVTVTRKGKKFEEYRWVKSGEDEPVTEPKKGEEVTGEVPGKSPEPEKPKGPAITGLNKPEDEVKEPEKEPEKKLEKVMTPDNLKSIESFSDLGMQGGMHKEDTFITTFKDGSKAIHKTMDPSATFGEVSSSNVNKILGWDVIPETVDEDFGKGRGSTQKWIEGSASPINRYHVKEHAIKLEEKHFDDLSKMFVLDMAVGNGDRTTGNIVIKDDKCYGIDNEIINKPMTDWQMEALDKKVAGEEYFGWCPLVDVFTSSELGQDDYIKFKKYVMNNMKNIIDHSDEILKYYEENKKSVKDGNIDNIKSNIDKMKKYYNK